jgi:hypothetical protein
MQGLNKQVTDGLNDLHYCGSGNNRKDQAHKTVVLGLILQPGRKGYSLQIVLQWLGVPRDSSQFHSAGSSTQLCSNYVFVVIICLLLY